jgi:hypothetical protein
MKAKIISDITNLGLTAHAKRGNRMAAVKQYIISKIYAAS